ncbi:flavin reductase family protein [Haliea salexigens]|uniref:flavin reductase family protein n=1 Tax=Haliea salexigens TaxID=287487 RepID=UPI00048594BE|nr:flavin reductase family protein [Haliea salexigens]
MVIDPQLYRRVLGQYPTGIAAITAQEGIEHPVAQIVGTFTSVSMEPPLVAFLPAKTSRSWASIKKSGKFCVNVLAENHQALCQTIFQGEPDVLNSLEYSLTSSGNPRFDGCLAWIDCSVWAVHDAGDHEIVIGLIENLEAGDAKKPLVFFQGQYGTFQEFTNK